MKKKCQNSKCVFYKNNLHVVKDGFYFRKDDHRKIQRYKCKDCGAKFSASTGTFEYRQKKRRINSGFLRLMCSKVSMRRAAELLKVNRSTIAHRKKYWGKKAPVKNQRLLKCYGFTTNRVQLDDLITKENSKLKPLAVSCLVDAETRIILGVEVSQIPSFGHLSKISKKKYGRRKCFHRDGLERLFKKASQLIQAHSEFTSDEHRNYPGIIKKYFPYSTHSQFKSQRATVAGQGELKKGGFDPLFAINHTCATLRDNINRLVRKTWATTKDPRRLQDHLNMFVFYHNQKLLKGIKKIPT